MFAIDLVFALKRLHEDIADDYIELVPVVGRVGCHVSAMNLRREVDSEHNSVAKLPPRRQQSSGEF